MCAAGGRREVGTVYGKREERMGDDVKMMRSRLKTVGVRTRV
jgi:hypothetical protein